MFFCYYGSWGAVRDYSERGIAMKRIGRITALMLIFAMLFTIVSNHVAATDITESDTHLVTSADLNYRDYVEPDVASVSDGADSDYSAIEVVTGVTADGSGSIPSYYNPVNITYDPAVRSQGNYGTCWAHASLALAEYSIYKQENILLNTSELALAYFEYNDVADPLGGTDDDVNQIGAYYLNQGYDFLSLGGNLAYSTYTLANWKGGTDEEKVPYENAATVRTNGLDDSYAFDDIAHLKNAYIIDFETDADEAKQLIMEYGAVGTSYYETKDDQNFSKDNNCYYQDGRDDSNHAIVIVGWDDDFSASNFTMEPEGDGAWLIRNSWGYNGYGHNGYFWISYYDTSLVQNAYAYEFVSIESDEYYDNNYQYDGCYATATLANVYSAANVFTCKNDYEVLKAVGVDVEDVNETLTVNIYKNLTDSKNPASGSLVSSTTAQTSYEGFYTIPLETAVNLEKDDTFAVVISSSSTFSIGIEWLSTGFLTCTPSANEGESFLGNGLSWADAGTCYGRNLRIKAYTNTLSEDEVETIPEVDGTETINLKDCTFKMSQTIYTYTGEACTPTVKVTYNGALVPATEYTLTYAKNINAGTANIYVTASNSEYLTGYKTLKFTISPVAQTLTASVADTMTLGATAAITATSSSDEVTISFGSSNTSVVSVASDGTMTAKGIGTAVITVAAKGDANHSTNTQTFNVTVIPADSKISSATVTGNNSIKLTFAKANGASNYYIYRKTSSTDWSLVAKPTGTTYTDTSSLTSGTTYIYKVVTYNSTAGIYGNKDTGSVSVKYLASPTVSSLVCASTGIKVTWNKITGATGYYVYRSTNGSSYSKVKTITSGSTVSYTDTGANTNGSKYYYRIVAYNSSTTSLNGATKSTYRLSTPSISSAKNTASKKVTLKWSKNSKATGYQIKMVTGSKTFTAKVTKNSTTKVVVSSLKKGATYKAYIRSYITVGGTTYYSKYSSAKSVKVKK